jgi:hypothetical protein
VFMKLDSPSRVSLAGSSCGLASITSDLSCGGHKQQNRKTVQAAIPDCRPVPAGSRSEGTVSEVTVDGWKVT